MSSLRRSALGCVAASLLLLGGCRHRVLATVAPPPPLPTISVPPPTHHLDMLETLDTETSEPLELEVARLPLPHFRPRATSARQLALLLPRVPAPTLALGELTTGGETDNARLQQETQALLQGQQQRLNAVPAVAGGAHGREVEQAKLFLERAWDAWRRRDVEGARVLATKVKVLLDDTEH